MSEKNHNHSHDQGHSAETHVVPTSLFFKVFFALVFLTILTVAASRIDFGLLNIVIAMVIASIKASLVVLFFMHLKYENPLTWLYAFFPIFLLFLLIGGLFLDNPLR